ncbi:autotransporter outer membrane beta-barrel domain-containing protein [Flavihumibacter profundi]|uniref:autotransporter outer membrane beta-barrel domain-containing protein n=1 Tax=Flavihumibacter profundi TaxID=2716883 RepID=UPI001CC52C5C|nr:autotransporter outer membrane beta-barrel domain-containing protein [Flavihumibacter profundi]MBZ5859373.1 porin family protein [Flavihumibacter profundi]
MKYSVCQIYGCLQKYVKTYVALFIALVFFANAQAQVKDSVSVKPQKEHLNTLKINLTSYILYRNGFQLNYERVLSHKRSITAWGGPIQFPMPSIIANTSLNFDENKKKSGYTFGADYRFYLNKENKFNAPRGVYLAPFMSYYHFNNQKSGKDTATNADVSLNTKLDMLNIGGELGYQFVIKNRFVIDCVLLGPSITSYKWNIQLNGTTGDLNEKQQAILDALKEKYPLLKDLTGNKEVSGSGVSSLWSVGLRYALHIGYRF